MGGGRWIGTGWGTLSYEPQAKPLANNSDYHVLKYNRSGPPG